jgi:HAD superfamily hydrolase (TIGR01509 family)
MIHGVIFDLGSTLLYSQADGLWETILPRMNADLLAGLQAHGYRRLGAEFVQHFAATFSAVDRQRQQDWQETTAVWVLEKTLADLGAARPPAQVSRDVLRAYYAYSESLWRPMPGVYEVLERLVAQGLKLAIISNASDNANVQRLIDLGHFRHYFDPVIVSGAVGVRKPAPAIFNLVLTPWGLPPAECVMIGDTLEADMRGAQLTGLHNVWLTAYADRPSNRAWRKEITPEAEIAELAQLPAVLAGI